MQQSGLVLILLLLVMFALGYFGFKALGARRANLEVDRWRDFLVSSAPESRPPAVDPTKLAIQAQGASGPGARPGSSPARPRAEDDLGLGRSLPFIDQSWGIQVSKDQGLLAIEWKGAGTASDVRIDERKVGRAPLAVALSPGRHELIFNREGESSFRYVVVQRGETRIIETPE